MLTLDQVMTLTEAAHKWGYADGSTIRKAIERGRFESHEIKRSGRVWLLTYESMCRVFGEPNKEYGTDTYDAGEFMSSIIMQEVSDDDVRVTGFIKKIYHSLHAHHAVILLDEKGKILIKLDSIEEANLWLRRMRYAFKLSQSWLKDFKVY